MRRFTRIGLFAFLIFYILGCGLFDGGTDIVVDDYELAWIDLHEQRALFKHEELISPYVFAVGHNSKFIFAKQHPLIQHSSDKIDTSVVNYYIIERTKNDFQDKPTYGPLTEEAFNSKCIELKIENVEFDLEYPTDL